MMKIMATKKSYKILIVEDESAIQKPITEELIDLGYTIIVAHNGKEALILFEKEAPDLILLDIVLPEKNGFDVLEDIRYKFKSNVPVIVVSNLESPQDMETAKNLGATKYIKKGDTSLRSIMMEVHNIFYPKK